MGLAHSEHTTCSWWGCAHFCNHLISVAFLKRFKCDFQGNCTAYRSHWWWKKFGNHSFFFSLCPAIQTGVCRLCIPLVKSSCLLLTHRIWRVQVTCSYFISLLQLRQISFVIGARARARAFSWYWSEALRRRHKHWKLLRVWTAVGGRGGAGAGLQIERACLANVLSFSTADSDAGARERTRATSERARSRGSRAFLIECLKYFSSIYFLKYFVLFLIVCVCVCGSNQHPSKSTRARVT